MRILYDLINQKAIQSFGKAINKENYDEYEKTWFHIVHVLQLNFELEGLTDTAKELDRIIVLQSKLNKFTINSQ